MMIVITSFCGGAGWLFIFKQTCASWLVATIALTGVTYLQAESRRDYKVCSSCRDQNVLAPLREAVIHVADFARSANKTEPSREALEDIANMIEAKLSCVIPRLWKAVLMDYSTLRDGPGISTKLSRTSPIYNELDLSYYTDRYRTPKGVEVIESDGHLEIMIDDERRRIPSQVRGLSLKFDAISATTGINALTAHILKNGDLVLSINTNGLNEVENHLFCFDNTSTLKWIGRSRGITGRGIGGGSGHNFIFIAESTANRQYVYLFGIGTGYQYIDIINRDDGTLVDAIWFDLPDMERDIRFVDDTIHRGTDHSTHSNPQWTNSIGMHFRRISPGTFAMGTDDCQEPDDNSCCRLHDVYISRGFSIGMFEVTNQQFDEFLVSTHSDHVTSENPDNSKYDHGLTRYGSGPILGNYPVITVSWVSARKFCLWLSKKEKKKYDLPTEAEWEYCCRAGSRSKYSFGNDTNRLRRFENIATQNVTDIPEGAGSSPVGSFLPNRWLLYDMHGNVREFCRDRYAPDYYLDGPEGMPFVDPLGPPFSPRGVQEIVVRGGCWVSGSKEAQSAYRGSRSTASFDTGFRIACYEE